MDLEQRVKALEQELEILKAQIQATLLDIQEQLLNSAHPSLRSAETAPKATPNLAASPGGPAARVRRVRSEEDEDDSRLAPPDDDADDDDFGTPHDFADTVDERPKERATAPEAKAPSTPVRRVSAQQPGAEKNGARPGTENGASIRPPAVNRVQNYQPDAVQDDPTADEWDAEATRPRRPTMRRDVEVEPPKPPSARRENRGERSEARRSGGAGSRVAATPEPETPPEAQPEPRAVARPKNTAEPARQPPARTPLPEPESTAPEEELPPTPRTFASEADREAAADNLLEELDQPRRTMLRLIAGIYNAGVGKKRNDQDG